MGRRRFGWLLLPVFLPPRFLVNLGRRRGVGMEYVVVTFDPNDIRDVIAGGNVVGETETELIVQPNYYVVSLSGSGYAPTQWYGLVSGTTAGRPLTIRFGKA
jgi:hypothetical protein